MIDIERDEQRARDQLIIDHLIPTPSSADVDRALHREGIIDLTVADRGTLTSCILPPGWTAEADPVSHRHYHLVDASGARRFTCFWQAPHPFSSEHGYGDTVIAEEGDGLRRVWTTERDELWVRDMRRGFTISCPTCRLARSWTAGGYPDEIRERMVMVQELAELDFKRLHICRGERQ